MANTSRTRSSEKVGLPPGSLVHIGDIKVDKVEVSLIDYSEKNLEERAISSLEEISPCKDAQTTSWLNLYGIHDTQLIAALGEYFGLHALVLEDILNTKQRPTFEDHGEYIFFSLKMLSFKPTTKKLNIEQVSFILGDNTVLSFQERRGDVFEPIRERLRESKGKVRQRKADYLVYLLIDAVVDQYFAIIEYLSDKIDSLEERALDDPDPELLVDIQQTRKQIIKLRKSIYPLREAVRFLDRLESKLINKSMAKYYNDLYDNIIQVIESLDADREAISAVKDVYLTSISNKMNNIMKVLTIMASIFIPLTFVAGIYGMNFAYIPELEYRYGYFIVWGIMIVMVAIMLYFFRKKRWL